MIEDAPRPGIAVVLAGGASSRFGGDKLAADLGGESVLVATILASRLAASEVIVAGPPHRGELPLGGLQVTAVPDTEPDGGPLSALAGVLSSPAVGSYEIAIVVGGDMPGIVPAVLRSMVDRLSDDDELEAVLLASDAERRQVLPLAVRLEPARRAAADALQAGDRSLARFIGQLRIVELPEEIWRRLDPKGLTLADVDTREDLERLRAGRSGHELGR